VIVERGAHHVRDRIAKLAREGDAGDAIARLGVSRLRGALRVCGGNATEKQRRAYYLQRRGRYVVHGVTAVRGECAPVKIITQNQEMRMRSTIAAVLLLVAACGPRQVEVRTAPTQTADVAIHFTNNLSKAVNVYVNNGGSDLFVRQVAANTTEHLPVPGVRAGTVVTLKATPVDGSQGYAKAGVTMTEMVDWRVP
jgi:hypothetical protein